MLVDKHTLNVVDDFQNFPIKGSKYNPFNDIAITDDDIIIPEEAREAYLNAEDDDVRRLLIAGSRGRMQQATEETSPYFEEWFLSNTEEGRDGATAYKNQGYYDYAKYYSDVVISDPKAERERMSSMQPIPQIYMNENHPIVTAMKKTESNDDIGLDIQRDIMKLKLGLR